MDSMKAITVHQPFASLIAVGEKTIETRPRPTPYRGLLANHAARKPLAVRDPYHRRLLASAGLDVDQLPTGAIVAFCRLVHCELNTPDICPCYPQYALSDFRAGWYAWHFRDVCALKEPLSVRGHGGLWTVPAELANSSWI
jgi:hypothetical protein